MKKFILLASVVAIVVAALAFPAMAHADAADAAEEWTSYLCYYLGFC